MVKQDTLKKIHEEIDYFTSRNNKRIINFKEKSVQIIKVCSDLSDSWSKD
jgi:hypothetical protein